MVFGVNTPTADGIYASQKDAYYKYLGRLFIARLFKEWEEEEMGIRDVAWNTVKWQFMKKRLGYTNEEMKKFRENPRNEDVLSKVPEFLSKTIIVEVVDSHGCNSQHGVGDKFYFDGAGNLLTKLCPKRICVYALNAITMQVFTAGELICAGVDPNEMRFKRAACFDVGVECGGWGRIVMEIRVEDRDKA